MPNPIVNSATTVWKGDLPSGSGTVNLDTSGAGEYRVGWKARSEESGSTTTPEELIAAAYSTCFSMQFSHELAEAGSPPTQLDTNAKVTFLVGAGITKIELDVTGKVDGLSEGDFTRIAQSAKANCPVSQALAGVGEITLAARLG